LPAERFHTAKKRLAKWPRWWRRSYDRWASVASSSSFHAAAFAFLVWIASYHGNTVRDRDSVMSHATASVASQGPEDPDGLDGADLLTSFGNEPNAENLASQAFQAESTMPLAQPGKGGDIALPGGFSGLELSPTIPSGQPTENGIGLGAGNEVPQGLGGDGPSGKGFPFPGGGLGGRNNDTRAKLALKRGGSKESEGAVEKGLKWIVNHQRPDGSWHFEHRFDGVCQECDNPGTFAPTTAATGLALLPLLGAGNTHKEGRFQAAVDKGLYYLQRKLQITPDGGDLREGNMYAQGIATIALCEAYAMTGDGALKANAQSAVDFICYAQDHHGGGWRYTPGEPGDTTVLGWQLMALKSADLAGLRVPSPTIFLTKKFLDGVQKEYGSEYGYQSKGDKQTTTAIGLLCRMYTGWKRDERGLQLGVARLAKLGPDGKDLYFDYYAAQVLCHYGGPKWERFNQQLRDWLVQSQSNTGHEAGSWFNKDDVHAEVGGRLYCTTMALMTLEVYYRYLPLYEDNVLRDF
jgi:hypothetical protein